VTGRVSESVATTIVADEATIRRLISDEIERALQPIMAAMKQNARGHTADDAHALMTANELATLLHVDRRVLRRLVHQGDVPSPIVLGDQTLRWRRRVIEDWLRNLEQRT
jgi:predicted DNA-binding transcriptional regulator AlpA